MQWCILVFFKLNFTIKAIEPTLNGEWEKK